jgi:hypothetical protein
VVTFSNAEFRRDDLLPLSLGLAAPVTLLTVIFLGLAVSIPQETRLRTQAWVALICLPTAGILSGIAVLALLKADLNNPRAVQEALPTILPFLGLSCLGGLAGLGGLICLIWLLSAAAFRLGDRSLGVMFLVCLIALHVVPGVAGAVLGMAMGGSGGPAAIRSPEGLRTIAVGSAGIGVVVSLIFNSWLIYLVLRLRARAS